MTKDWKLVLQLVDSAYITIGTPYEDLHDNAHDYNFQFTLDFNAPSVNDVSVNHAKRTTCNILMKKGCAFQNIKQ